MATATAKENREKPVLNLVRYLAEHDMPRVSDIIEEFPIPLLNVAWVAGVVEFGRPDWVKCGRAEPTRDGQPCNNAKIAEYYDAGTIIPDGGAGWSWTGGKNPGKHTTIEKMLAEIDELPPKFVSRRRVENPDRIAVRMNDEDPFIYREEAVDRSEFAIRIRLTAKGSQLLAEQLLFA